ncbi:hypothetical protein E1B28_001708 [Marasmius oreades]|uniref:Uncharacterized protein n=1 Tax=Marasmius oreades TaxID=181124 RepID=A0A9P7V3Z7_9AGAR|nr:uncharacterized protein E1B28_001708 [Marasmius oreades]KAG7099910.1 hypothetical protein E1B28_001708 [Marasmius oreades]
MMSGEDSHLNMALNSSSTNINEEDECSPSLNSNKTNKGKGKDKETPGAKEPTSQPLGKKPPSVINIAAIVGGMSAQKQKANYSIEELTFSLQRLVVCGISCRR